jgi:hypothetical protein
LAAVKIAINELINLSTSSIRQTTMRRSSAASNLHPICTLLSLSFVADDARHDWQTRSHVVHQSQVPLPPPPFPFSFIELKRSVAPMRINSSMGHLQCAAKDRSYH